MSFKFGMILMPLMILGMILRDKGPVAKFVKAGAVSPATARRPESIAIERNDHLHIPGAVKRGVLVALDDGRYYVDLDRRRRRRWIGGGAVLTLATAAAIAAILLWPDTTDG
jgi:hypothetical protein